MTKLLRTVAMVGTFVLVSLTGVAPHAAGGPATFTIGVDNASPGGHNFEYVDYFPRAGVNVHQGDVIDFKWNFGLDGLHTATFLPPGTPRPDLIVPEFDEGFQLQFNPAVLHPSDTSCGSESNPCTYDGSTMVNSGAIANAAPSHFFVRLDVPPGPLTFICLIHPGMAGTVNVVPDATPASTQAAIDGAAAAQLVADTHGAKVAEAQSESRSVKTNPDGTHTVTITAGTATQYVEVAEMLPRKVEVRLGDTVEWVTRTLKDPHTVTFPEGPGSDPVDPLPPFCESGGGDTPPPGGPPPSFGCPNPLDSEIHVFPQPQGPTVISSTSTVASSGIISTLPPGPDHYSFSFVGTGTFAYMCRIHDHMVGTVMVVGR